MNREERRKLAHEVLEVALDGDSSVDDLEWLLDEFHNTNGPETILLDLDYIERLEAELAHRGKVLMRLLGPGVDLRTVFDRREAPLQ